MELHTAWNTLESRTVIQTLCVWFVFEHSCHESLHRTRNLKTEVKLMVHLLSVLKRPLPHQLKLDLQHEKSYGLQKIASPVPRPMTFCRRLPAILRYKRRTAGRRSGNEARQLLISVPTLTVHLQLIDQLHLRHVVHDASVYYPEAAILVYQNTLALYAVSIKTCPASLVSV